MLVKLAFVMQKLKKYLKNFCHDQQRRGGGQFLDFMGEHSCYEGNIKLMGVHPVPLGKPCTQKLIKHHDRLLRKLRKTHCNTTEELYKTFRNRVVSENRKSKIKYFDNYFHFGQVSNALSILNQRILSKISLSLL